MRSRLWPIAASIVLLSALAHAQTSETMPDKQDSHSSGTAPHGMGSTGWTGGTGGSHIGTGTGQETAGQGSAERSTESGPLSEEMATGVDLNGPPMRFPANRTPE
ncbi:MAG TPA: hypothetical protein VHA55_02960 [Pseudorhodoplanes sp.]|jgi:hypothetical protein|nr:hypothetical protein [Pseudorhodoplanes sp.]